MLQLDKIHKKRQLKQRKTNTVVAEPVQHAAEVREHKWWEKVSIKYAFSHPHVRSRLEKLMGSNVVSLTDRAYMQKLQDRILEDYAQSMNKRIGVRQAEEMERVKNLVLIGKIPLENAPPEMANHPVMLIEMYCNKLIAERRAKIKVQKIHIPNYLYWDDTPDPPSGLCIEKGHVFRKNEHNLCSPPEKFLAATEEEDIENRYMFSAEEFENMKYEDPLIKDLRDCETVEEMYALADEIIGALQTITEKKEELVELGPQPPPPPPPAAPEAAPAEGEPTEPTTQAPPSADPSATEPPDTEDIAPSPAPAD